MAGHSRQRIPTHVLGKDRQNLITLQTLPDYSPRNSALSIGELQQLVLALAHAEEAKLIAKRAFEVAREQERAAGMAFHSAMRDVGVEVVAQYGPDSPCVHAIGYKQRSERRHPPRRKQPTE